MISIRRAVPEDLRFIPQIESKSFGADAWNEDMFAPYFQHVFLVGTVDGSIAGYLAAFVRGRRAEIDSIAILPSQRQKKIGARMLRRALALLKRKGFEAVWLSVRTDNNAAIGLYEKCGFKRARRIAHYYEDGAPALRMKLTLAG